ncbi:TPA: hypothetical protein NVH30_002961 [Vibrio cholerae]|nr:hypothetical protein [Vibrio cholerae]HCJ7280610.1 hypothetical protein [Vibrio cholerae]HCJ7318264.1 hypothetical protein [Vibrio cholerae]
MAETKQSKRLVLTVAKDEWKIKNRFIGFLVLFFIAFVCLVAPKVVEDGLNRK